MNPKNLAIYIEKGLFYVYQAEKQILEGLKTMEDKATSSSLKKAFRQHEKETEKQIKRLEEIFGTLDIDFKKDEEFSAKKAIDKGKEILQDIVHIGSSFSKGGVIRSLLDQGKEMMEQFKEADSDLFDIMLATGGQQIEQVEIGAYTLLCHLANKMEEPEVSYLLNQNLEEEEKMLSKLNEIMHEEFVQEAAKA